MPYVATPHGDVYHEVVGEGPPLVLLHGGFSSIETLRPQIDGLSGSFRLYVPERPGHGRTPDRDGPITFDGMVRDALEYLDAVGLESAHVLGFSDGAIAGLLLGIRAGDRLDSLTAISANLDPSGLVEEEPTDPAEPFRQFDPEMLADYRRLSPDGPEHASVVVDKLLRLWREEPRITPEQLHRIAVPTLVMAGEHDSIRPEHTRAIAAAIPSSRLVIVPGSTHLLMQERPEVVNAVVAGFLTEEDRRHPAG